MNAFNLNSFKVLFLTIALFLLTVSIVRAEDQVCPDKDLTMFEKQLEQAKSHFEKADELLKDGIISKTEYQQLKSNYENAQKLYDLQKSSKSKINFDIKTSDKENSELQKEKDHYNKLMELYKEGIVSQKELFEAEVDYKISAVNLNRFQNSSNITLITSLLTDPLTIILKTPLKYITSKYGNRIHPITGLNTLHTGIDIAAPYGVAVYAYNDGQVVKKATGDRAGNFVEISHGNGYSSRYLHLKNSVVSVNQFVSKGQLIGFVGSTGWSTGSHLHFEIRANNVPQNINFLFDKK